MFSLQYDVPIRAALVKNNNITMIVKKEPMNITLSLDIFGSKLATAIATGVDDTTENGHLYT